ALRSTNFSGSVDTRSPSKVSYCPSSRSCASRVRASIRKCFSHFGQTFILSSRSFFQIICRQFSHFTHRPSVFTFFSPEVSSSPDSRLNQAIISYESRVLSFALTASRYSRLIGMRSPPFDSTRASGMLLIIFGKSLCEHLSLLAVRGCFDCRDGVKGPLAGRGGQECPPYTGLPHAVTALSP